MVLFTALNSSSSSSDSEDEERIVSEEAIETEAFDLHSKALTALGQKKHVEAKELFLRVLDHPFVTRNKEAYLRGGSMHPSRHMKYAALKNLGAIFAECGRYETAAEYYFAALDIDTSDINVWYKLGLVGKALKNYGMAAKCLQSAILINPMHWLSLNELLLIQYILPDDCGCLLVVAKALKMDPYFPRAHYMKKKVLGNASVFAETWQEMKEQEEVDDVDVEVDAEEANRIEELLKKMTEEWVEKCNEKTTVDLESLPFVILLPENAGKDEAWDPCWVKLGEQTLQKLVETDEAGTFDIFQRVDVRSWFEAADGSLARIQADLKELKSHDEISRDEENKDAKDEAVDQKKTKKRRRADELAKLEEWGFVKRRSGRAGQGARNSFAALAFMNRQKSQVLHVNFDEMLSEFLPAGLMQNKSDGANTKDANAGEENSLASELAGSCSNSADESSRADAGAGAEPKKKEKTPLELLQDRFDEMLKLRNFLHDSNGNEAFIFLYDLVLVISKMPGLWERGLPQVFIKLYPHVRRWNGHFIKNCDRDGHDDPELRARIVEDGFLTMVYADLCADRCQFWTSDEAEETDPSVITTFDAGVKVAKEFYGEQFSDEMEALLLLSFHSEFLAKNGLWPEFYVRLCVLQSRLAFIANRMNDALFYLQATRDWIENADLEPIKMPNCFFFQSVDRTSVDKQIAELSRKQNLSGILEYYQKQDYRTVVELLMPTLDASEDENEKSFEAKIKDLPERHVLLQYLIESIVQLKEYPKLFEAAHPALEEALKNYQSCEASGENETKEQWASSICYILEVLDVVMHNNRDILQAVKPEDLASLCKDLTKIIQINFDFVNNARNICSSADRNKMQIKSLCPWTILYRIASHGEKSAEDGQPAGEEAIPGSVFILLTGHEWLGRHAWCCSDSGTFLLTMVELLPKLPGYKKGKTALVDQALEQCFYCLYSYPSSKSKAKHLTDHGVNGVELTWKRAVDFYRFVAPKELPEFDSARVPSISADLEAMFRRIISLAPSKYDPATYVGPLEQYVEGDGPGKLQGLVPSKILREIRRMPDLYFMLADYYFKNKDWNKAAKHYQLDSTINPLRMDSWAGNALARTGALETKLNSCQPIKLDRSMFDKTSAALRCFHRTLILDKKNVNMWIEYGSLSYMMHSHTSRQLKQDSSVDLGMDMLTFLEKEKENLLAKAKHCFETASKLVAAPKKPDDSDDNVGWDERWLHHYMLGKIMCKFGAPVQESLPHFHKATEMLHETGASYPKKINYNSPVYLSLEALEVYYRIHATSLKQLMLWEEGIFADEYDEQVAVMMKVLSQQEKSAFVLGDDAPKANTSSEETTKEPEKAVGGTEKTAEKSEKEKEKSTSPSAQPRDANSMECAVERQALVQKCLNALKECAIRFPHHYKSIYRCAQYYYSSVQSKDLLKARNILLGVPGKVSEWAKYPYMPGPGLFAERKKNNLFSGIWRIPSNEVDRPGSFAAHMSRSVNLLLNSSVNLEDFDTLLSTAIQLARKPEADKMYLYETERKNLSSQAMELCIVVLKEKLFKAVEANIEGAKRDVLLDIYAARLKASKHPIPYHGFTPLLVEAFVTFKGNPQNKPAPGIVDEAVKYCSQFVSETDLDRLDKRKKPQQQGPTLASSVPAAEQATKEPALDSDSDSHPEPPMSPASRPSSPEEAYVPGMKLPTTVTDGSKKRGVKRGGGRRPGAPPAAKRPRLTPGDAAAGMPGTSQQAVAAAVAAAAANVEAMHLLASWQAPLQGASSPAMDPFLASLYGDPAISAMLAGAMPGLMNPSLLGTAMATTTTRGRRPRGSGVRGRASGTGRGSRGARGGAVAASLVGLQPTGPSFVDQQVGSAPSVAPVLTAPTRGRGRGSRGPRGPRGSSLLRQAPLIDLTGPSRLSPAVVDLTGSAMQPRQPVSRGAGPSRASSRGGRPRAPQWGVPSTILGSAIPAGLTIRPVASGSGGSRPRMPPPAHQSSRSGASTATSVAGPRSGSAAFSELSRRPGLEIVPNTRPSGQQQSHQPGSAPQQQQNQQAVPPSVSDFQRMFQEAFLPRRDPR